MFCDNSSHGVAFSTWIVWICILNCYLEGFKGDKKREYFLFWRDIWYLAVCSDYHLKSSNIAQPCRIVSPLFLHCALHIRFKIHVTAMMCKIWRYKKKKISLFGCWVEIRCKTLKALLCSTFVTSKYPGNLNSSMPDIFLKWLIL